MRGETLSTPPTIENTSYRVGIGARVGAYRGWLGGIDEISMYDRALDGATIDGHFRAGDDGAPPIARADPVPTQVQPRSGVIHLTADKAGSSLRCAPDGAGYAPCKPETRHR